MRVRQQNNPGHGIVQIVEPIAGQADHARGYLTVAGWTREYAQIYSFTSELCKVAGLRACFFLQYSIFGKFEQCFHPPLETLKCFWAFFVFCSRRV